MTEDELKALKDLAAPPPRADAKATAMAAAMAAFDAAAEAPAKNIDAGTQGTAGAPRLMHASQADRRQKMRAPMLYKIAAGIAIVVVATPAAVYFLDQNGIMRADRLTVAKPPSGRFPAGNKLIYDHDRNIPYGSPAPALEGSEKQNTDQRTSTDRRPLEERIAEALETARESESTPPADGKKDSSSQDAGQFPDGGKLVFDRLDGAAPSAKDGDAAPVERPEPAKPMDKIDRQTLLALRDAGKISQQLPYSSNTYEDFPDLMLETVPMSPKEAEAFRKRMQPTITGEYAGVAPLLPSNHGDLAGVSGDVSIDAKGNLHQLNAAQQENRDQFEAAAPNPVKQVAAEPVSTFSIDVDTASYAFVRRALNGGRLPPKDSVRVEEMINYFPYDYPRADSTQVPFQPTVTVVPAPWKPTNKLVHIGIKGYDVVAADRPRANIVLLIDQSGSMQPADRLPLVKNAFRMLIDELKPEDTVGIVTYASGSGIALEPTRVAEKHKILSAIDALHAGGSTAGAAGIADAYRLAEAHFDKTGVNRIILATDGDFNVGISDRDELKGFVERKRAAGIFLSILGVGQGNYNDAMMQTLAQNGNGTAAYADTLNEARKVLVDEASSTLFTIAKDVKIQVEFNPAVVSEYRLIGYETRALRREDFNNDKVDAGDIGSGHTVTAIYEVTPVGAPKLVENLRYGKPETPSVAPASEPSQNGELGFLKLRYKLPKEDTSKLLTVAITSASEKPDIAAAPEDVRFSVAAAAFGQLLRGLPYLQGYSYDEVLALAQAARGPDLFGYRAEFANLVRLAKSARP